jgi:hypothetical protein
MSNELLYESLHNYYSDDHNMNILLSIIQNKKISLRIIDWFVSNYSKKCTSNYILYKTPSNTYTILNNENNTVHGNVNVFHSYKCQLKSFSKKNFDPFCRRNRIEFICNNQVINTTIGQLNFFKWAINNAILEYILKSYGDIENDMNHSYKSVKYINKNSKTRKKRQELSISGSRGLNKHSSPVKVIFN